MSGAEADRMPGLRGGRELTTMQVAKQLSTGQSWLRDCTREVSAKVNSCQGGRLCCLKNVVAQFIGLAPLSLRGARFLAYASEQAPQSVWGRGIATPRQVGARNDKRRLHLINHSAMKIWRGDLRMLVSSLFLASPAEASCDLAYCVVSRAGRGRGG
jgi:hypothetical protein